MDALIGIKTSDLIRLLKENDFSVDPAYRKRLILLFLTSLANSRGRKREDKLYGEKIAHTEVRKPVFILGHWRSGTTLLHSLITMDDHFAFPNLFQVSRPHQCLTVEKIVENHLANAAAEKRPMDDMEVTFRDPGEDESALSVLCQRSPLISWIFPKHRDKYDQFHTFENVSAKDFERWKEAITYFLKKLTWRYDKPLVLKSPIQTARVKILLELFPDARFVHISRNPYAVYQSTKKLYQKMLPNTCLQEPDMDAWEEIILENYKTIYDAYLDQRSLVPEEQLYELSFESLEQNIPDEIEKIYDHFDWLGYERLKPKLEDYLEKNKHFKKNKHHEISQSTREKINILWIRSFEAFDYETVK